MEKRLSLSGIALEGVTPQKGGGWLWPFGDHFFGAEGAEKWELLKIFGQNYVQWPIFGAAGAENFVKFRYFSEKSPNFVKVEDFIAQLCIKWRKKSRKPLYIGYFSKFVQWPLFRKIPLIQWPKLRSPPPQFEPWFDPCPLSLKTSLKISCYETTTV